MTEVRKNYQVDILQLAEIGSDHEIGSHQSTVFEPYAQFRDVIFLQIRLLDEFTQRKHESIKKFQPSRTV